MDIIKGQSSCEEYNMVKKESKRTTSLGNVKNRMVSTTIIQSQSVPPPASPPPATPWRGGGAKKLLLRWPSPSQRVLIPSLPLTHGQCGKLRQLLNGSYYGTDLRLTVYNVLTFERESERVGDLMGQFLNK